MSIQDRIAALATSLKALTEEVLQSNDDGARRQLHGIVQEEASILESPLQISLRMMMEPHMNACLRIAQALGIVEILSKDFLPKTASQLIETTKADSLLIGMDSLCIPLPAIGLD
jgi:hypothetical protein